MIFTSAVRGNPEGRGGWSLMTQSQTHDGDRRLAILLERQTRLSEASLLINDGLELDTVLQRVLDSARSLTGAQYGVLTTLDQSGFLEYFFASGLSAEEAPQLWGMPGGPEIFEYVNSISGPWRVSDFAGHAREMGLPEFRPPRPMRSFLTVPIDHRGDRVGNVHMARGDQGEEFSDEDEETLVMFAAQAAVVIANARRYRDEQRARAGLEALINTSPVGVVVFDARTGALVSFNQEAARLMEVLRDDAQPPEEFIETLTIRRADGGEVSLQEWPMAEALSTGETVRAEEITFRVPDGRSLTVLLNATPIRDVDGGLESFVVTLQDLTPLGEQERLRAEFLGMVSHELRAPLASIRGSATTVLDASVELDAAELRQFMRIIVDETDTMRDLIGDLLDVARIETGTLPVNPEPAGVAMLVDRARNTFLSSGGRNSLDIDLAPDLPLVMADARRIVQVIVNLLSNAARHSPEETAIRVTAALEDSEVAISIVDAGRGIPSEHLPRLFRRISRADGNDRDLDSGFRRNDGSDSGLGLAICRGIVEAHGGRIRAESGGPGMGATFTFTLPTVADATAQRPSPTGRLRREAREDGAPILVVDDDPRTLMHVRSALTEAGYRTIVTPNPQEAIQLMAADRPHLVLLDMMLPGTDGIDLMRDLSAIADAPVVFLSAYGGDQVIARAFEMGAADYIVKPFSPTELTARVRAALRRREGPRHAEPADPYTRGDLTIDYARRLVTMAGQPLELTAKEYGLLRALSINAGRVLTHEQVLRQVWGPDKGDLRGLRSLLLRLRRKLGEDGGSPTWIFSVPHVGYRMAEAETAEQAPLS